MLDTHARKYVQPVIKNIADIFIKYNFSANQVTIIAFILGLFSGLLAYLELGIVAVALLWISGLLDAVDGTIARVKGSTPFGTIMDITFDRIVEIAVILGLAIRYPHSQLSMIALTSSIIISMTIFLTTGMMAENTGRKSFLYQAGLAERSEGFVFLSIMILLPDLLYVSVPIFTIAILFTALQRFNQARIILKKN